MLLNLPPLQAEARLKQDIQAAKTVAMAVVHISSVTFQQSSMPFCAAVIPFTIGWASLLPFARFFQAPQTQLSTCSGTENTEPLSDSL